MTTQELERSADASPRTAPARDWAAVADRTWLPLVGLPLDALCILAAFRTSYHLRVHTLPKIFPFAAAKDLLPWSDYSGFLTAIVPLWLVLLIYGAKAYSDPHQSVADRAVRVVRGCFEATLVTLALSFLYQRFSDSRFMILAAFPLAAAYASATHALTQTLYQKARRRWTDPTPTLLVGEGRAVDVLLAKLERSNHRRLLRRSSLSKEAILELVRTEGLREVILFRANLEPVELIDLGDRLEAAGVRLRIVPGLVDLRMGEIQVDQGIGAPTLTLSHTSLSGSNYAVKRVFDILFCLLFFAAGAIPLALVSLLIKLDSPGPVLFRQRRVGYKGRDFYIFKFRTMKRDAEQLKDGLRHLNERSGPLFKIKDDPRITRVGRWLRRLSIDEIPQFLNVVKGEMSVVGPRPLPRTDLDQFELDGNRRHNILPGVTGLWQVSGRSDVDYDQMLALDLYYIEHWSLGLDLNIILRTVPAMLASRGAY